MQLDCLYRFSTLLCQSVSASTPFKFWVISSMCIEKTVRRRQIWFLLEHMCRCSRSWSQDRSCGTKTLQHSLKCGNILLRKQHLASENSYWDYPKKYFLRTLSARFAVPSKPPQTVLFSIIGCMHFPLRCRFILIFPVIVIWLSVSAIFSGSIFRIIFITRICQEVSRNSGDVGTLHWGHGSVTMSISRWAATAWKKAAGFLTSQSCGFWPDCGTVHLGILSCGECSLRFCLY